MIPHLVFGNPRCATPDPVYVFLLVSVTACVTVVAHSAFLLFCMWLAGFSIVARLRLALTPPPLGSLGSFGPFGSLKSCGPFRFHRVVPIFATFPSSRPVGRRE